MYVKYVNFNVITRRTKQQYFCNNNGKELAEQDLLHFIVRRIYIQGVALID